MTNQLRRGADAVLGTGLKSAAIGTMSARGMP